MVSRVIGLALCIIVALSAHAQQATNGAASPDDTNQQLLRRIDQLEAKVKQLEEKQDAPRAAAVAPAPEPPPSVDIPTVNEVAPRLKFIVFGDVGAQGSTHLTDKFVFGSFELFMRARLSDRVSVLGEAKFIPGNDNTISPDVERLILQYRASDYFTASIGRYHTWVGYYNTAFHFAQFLQTTTDRPFLYTFDESGGVLPMQDIGVTLTGRIPSGKLGVNYVVEAGNGRAWGIGVEPAQNRNDGNNSKSINGGLFMRPEKLSGLQLGFSVRHDNLTIPGPPAVHETIVTAHAVFINSQYEILNEAVYVRHTEPPTASVFNTSAFYTQFSRRFRAYRPYFRYQYFNAPNDDPVYFYSNRNNYAPLSAASFIGRLNGPSVGIRYDFTDYSALKFQYDRISLRGFSTVNGLTSQLAFTF
jgi:hypothetical protein